ncbi:RtcB family protein [candidate division KSB1 bacterium]|nr:RtcB family protein [candidate division KSB1 bacterium]
MEKVFEKLEIILDLPHNSFEKLKDGIIIRKGAVKVKAGELNVIPSNMGGDVALVKATNKVITSLQSLSHGTGRRLARGESKKFAQDYDFDKLRKQVIIPDFISDASLKTEAPYAYRDLDTCLQLLDEFVEIVERFSVIAYMWHGSGFFIKTYKMSEYQFYNFVKSITKEYSKMEEARENIELIKGFRKMINAKLIKEMSSR